MMLHRSPLQTVLVVTVAIARSHRLGGLTNRYLFHHTSRGQKSEIRVSARLGSSEGLLWLVDCHLLMSSNGLPSACLRPNLFLEQHQSCWIRALSYDLILPNSLFKGSVSKYSHVLRYQRVRASAYEFGVRISAHNTNSDASHEHQTCKSNFSPHIFI